MSLPRYLTGLVHDPGASSPGWLPPQPPSSCSSMCMFSLEGLRHRPKPQRSVSRLPVSREGSKTPSKGEQSNHRVAAVGRAIEKHLNRGASRGRPRSAHPATTSSCSGARGGFSPQRRIGPRSRFPLTGGLEDSGGRSAPANTAGTSGPWSRDSARLRRSFRRSSSCRRADRSRGGRPSDRIGVTRSGELMRMVEPNRPGRIGVFPRSGV